MSLEIGWADRPSEARVAYDSEPTLRLLGPEAAPVNVSQVPQLSPFRYPGGKTWCVPELRRWLSSLPRPDTFVEPFAGGAIAALTVAVENLADRVIICELDENVASVWKIVFGESDRDAAWLCRKIMSFEMSRDNVVAAFFEAPRNLRELAFLTILRNRVNRGGIMAPGASLQKTGENGRGIGSRWYAKTLVSRIKAIRSVRHKVGIVHGDAFEILGKHADAKGAAFFVDPPYTAGGKRAGSRLYNHNAVDHDRLFDTMAALRGAFLMTYDDSREVVGMAEKRGFKISRVPMKSTHHAVHYELLITIA